MALDDDVFAEEPIQEVDPSKLNPAEEEAPWGATMTVGNTVYAASIFWQPLQDPDNPLPEVRETAENVLDNADLYVVRPSGMPQYGLGISSEGHRSGMPVAALGLVDAFSDVPSSVSVFKVPEGWWFIAVRNDLILSEEDMLFLHEEDAKKNFISMMAVPDWGRKIAPKEWGIDGTEELDIGEILSRGSKVKLQKLKTEFSPKNIVYIAAIVLALGWLAYYIISNYFGGDEVIREVIAPPPIIKQVVDKPKIQNEPMPWDSLVLSTELASSCADAIKILTTSAVPGWKLGDINCKATGLSTTWTLEWGRIAFLKTALKVYNIKNLHFSVSEDGRTSAGTIPFNNIKKISSPPTMKTNDIMTELTDIFQALNLPITLSITNVQTEPTQKNALPMYLYSFVSFVFSSELPPADWESFFNSFASLEITDIMYNPESNVWKYEGRIYGRK